MQISVEILQPKADIKGTKVHKNLLQGKHFSSRTSIVLCFNTVKKENN